jgi:leader peptidase (prepilin peptidase) / N-methyltransferase
MSILFFALGAIIASFIGVLVARLNTGHAIVNGRSRCDACDTRIPPIMLVPVVSYLFAGGRARCCGAQISLWSPVSEVLLGALFVLSYLQLGLTVALPLLLVALCLLLALVSYDIQHQILPPTLLYPFVALALVQRFLLEVSIGDFFFQLAIAGGIGFFFLALHVLSRGRAMGFADAPLAFGLALLVGAPYALPGLAYSFWIGAAIGITILLRRPRGSRMGVEVPFAPFLAAGFLLSLFIIKWNLFDYIVVYPLR